MNYKVLYKISKRYTLRLPGFSLRLSALKRKVLYKITTMKKLIEALFSDRLIALGLILILLSSAFLLLTDTLKTPSSSEGFFFFNYAVAVAYFIAVLVTALRRHRWRILQSDIRYTTLLLLLWFISAFALNREMNVFDASVPWLCVFIFLSVITIILSLFTEHYSKVAMYILSFSMGAAFLLFAYYALYLVPLYVISIIGIIAIGISLHTYIPVLLAIVTLVLFRRITRDYKFAGHTFAAGAILPLLFCAGFMLRWYTVNNQINHVLNQHSLSDSKLPAWVDVSQHVPHDAITEKLMKCDLVYHSVDHTNNWLWGGMPTHNFNEPKQHDPLVVISTLFFGKPAIDENDRIKILESMYDSRYQAQERLWSGDELQTSNVINNVKLFPEYRMAYTEKILTVRNNKPAGWRGAEEAIYTFHLPEGSVVTSLSLWIKGHEAKGRLSTTAKADSAYKQVVGVENRDPSVVHWQEGNVVSVRVFPCNPNENRQFKIGITSPLRKDGNNLIYENIYFDGPTGKSALETTQFNFSKKPQQLTLPGFMSEANAIGDTYRADHTYQPYWELSCKAPELSASAFSFADTAYTAKPYQPAYTGFSPKTIYLDLNSAWTREEFDAILNNVKGKPVFVYQEKLTALNDQNKDAIFEQMSKLNFSLFPVYKIADPDNALLVTKSTFAAPNYKDLDESEFAARLTKYLQTPKQIKVFNMGDQLSPYLKTLRELRVFNYDQGDVSDLFNLISKKQFVKQQENDSTVVIYDAQLMLQRTPHARDSSDAPDHLLRLFAYNDIMKKAGPDFFTKKYIRTDLIDEARKAYVVSPLSSLLVLESQDDYKRFGIEDDGNSLKNASMKSSGSVPEPKEWLLIALVIAVVISMFYKKRQSPFEY